MVPPIEDILKLSERFFHSIELTFNSSLRYKTKNGYDIQTRWDKSANLVVFLIVFIVVPAVPFVIKSILEQITFTFVKDQLINFIIIWAVCALLIFPLIKIGRFFVRKDKEFKRKNILDVRLMIFCYLCKSIYEIELYLENNLFPHIENAKKFLERYLKESDMNMLVTFVNKEKKNSVIIRTNYELINLFEQYYKWFSLENETNKIIVSYQDIANKIVKRVNNEIELDSVLKPLKPLLIYEFSKLKNDFLNTKEISLSRFQKDCLLEFASEMSNLSQVENKLSTEFKINKFAFFAKIFSNIKNVLISDKIYISFFAWWIFLQIIIALILKIFMVRYNINMDSTILSVLIGVPLAASAAIVGIVIPNKRNKENG